MEERITFFFDGSFTGAYRDIPLRDGERIGDISVEENGLRYAPGASAELGSSGTPNSFGETPIEGGHRIVWHFQALNEPRTFTVGYRLSNLAIAFDDVVDVDLNVWGDEWEQTLQQLTAELTLRVVELAADRTPQICQSQSVNIFLPGDVDKWDLHMLHWQAWERGCKSLYYLRSKSVQRASHAGGEELAAIVHAEGKTDYEECLACQ